MNFEFRPVTNRPVPEPVRTGYTSNRSFRTGSDWDKKTLRVAGSLRQGKMTMGRARAFTLALQNRDYGYLWIDQLIASLSSHGYSLSSKGY